MRLSLYLSVFAMIFAASCQHSKPTRVPSSPEARTAYHEIQNSFGVVPQFLQAYPDQGIVGGWEEIKAVPMNQNSQLSRKEKELIGLAVASQIPSEHFVYLTSRAAQSHGATDQELREAIANAALVRHWSTFLNGSDIELKAFKEDTDKIIKNAKANVNKKMKREINVMTAEDAYEDVEQTFGFVPRFIRAFPKDAISGAWKMMKELELKTTALTPKTKQLISLGVSAQVPCNYCVYFHKEAARLEGATQKEIHEALAMASVVRHWSTVAAGASIPLDVFKKDVDLMIATQNKAKQD